MLDIPYIKQSQPRSCGAAALEMALAYYEIPDKETQIWDILRRPDGSGEQYIKSPDLARYSIQKGICALDVKAKDPLKILRICEDTGFVAITVMRRDTKKRGTTVGHFYVFTGFEGPRLRMHDPLKGPNKSYSKVEVRKLWLANDSGEVIGNEIVILGGRIPENPKTENCTLCGKEKILEPNVSVVR